MNLSNTSNATKTSNIIHIAAIQMHMINNEQDNTHKAIEWVEKAAKKGANIILLPELFTLPYFCKTQNPNYFDHAIDMDHWKSSWLMAFAKLAKQHHIVLPISFFEKAGPNYYNSIMIFDVDGQIVGHYRKSHIPDGPGYQEKFYFRPGQTGFKATQTHYGKIGVGICWDQWFPEAARIFALDGAEFLLYPTAIGNEPQDPAIQSKDHWQCVMRGHSAANVMPVIAANRVGHESDAGCDIDFYGHSFITDGHGTIKQELRATEEGIIIESFDRKQLESTRRSWGIFRDRRPDLYGDILS